LCTPRGSGGVGYLLKGRIIDVADFVDAAGRVAAGGTGLDPEVVAQLLARRRAPGPLEDLTSPTPRVSADAAQRPQ
jgi:hypothetical protein